LVVLLPKEIWLVDFKTDEFPIGTLAERTRFYERQLKLYASAFEKIYDRPVTNCWLHFLSAQQTVKI
jgi:ATP-dependent exoDNAse (exonuclease V) beta subunit